MDVPKDDDAAKEGGDAFGHDVVLLNDAEGAVAVVAHSIDFMPFEGRMEIEVSVAIDVAEGHGVWIASVAGKREHAGGGTSEDAKRLRVAELLPVSAHGSEIHIMKWF